MTGEKPSLAPLRLTARSLSARTGASAVLQLHKPLVSVPSSIALIGSLSQDDKKS